MSEIKNDAYKAKRYHIQVSTFVKILDQYGLKNRRQQVLDLGCGNGQEAVTLSNFLDCRAVGIDTAAGFDPVAQKMVRLQQYDGQQIPYEKEFFDGIYSFHVLEHADQPERVLQEMARVLKPGGFGYVGVPNKSRLFAYLTVEGKSLWRRIRNNLVDYWQRLWGRFDNRAGAHAGFYSRELLQRMSGYSRLYNVTRDYYRIKWHRRSWLIRLITALKLDDYVFPSVYVLGIK